MPRTAALRRRCISVRPSLPFAGVPGQDRNHVTSGERAVESFAGSHPWAALPGTRSAFGDNTSLLRVPQSRESDSDAPAQGRTELSGNAHGDSDVACACAWRSSPPIPKSSETSPCCPRGSHCPYLYMERRARGGAWGRHHQLGFGRFCSRPRDQVERALAAPRRTFYDSRNAETKAKGCQRDEKPKDSTSKYCL